MALEDRGEGLRTEAVERAFDQFWLTERARSANGLVVAVPRARRDAHRLGSPLVTAPSPPRPRRRTLALDGRHLAAAALRIALGALFLQVWIENLRKDLYTGSGYAGLVRGYIRDGESPEAWKSLMRFAADHAEVFARVQLVFELALALLLLAGAATRLVGALAAAWLAALWLSEIGVPHEWIWSLVFPALTAACVSVWAAGRTLGADAVLCRRLPRWMTG